MLPLVTIGGGGALYYIKGYDFRVLGNTIAMDTTDSVSCSDAEGYYGYADWIQRTYGGWGTFMPGGYANHKSGAIYFNKVYRALMKQHSTGAGITFVRFDGSGIYKNTSSFYATRPWANGRGYEFISPSGFNTDFKMAEPAFCNYNGVLYIVAALHSDTVAHPTSLWFTKCQWALPNNNITGAAAGALKRRYKTFAIKIEPDTNKEKRLANIASSAFPGDMALSPEGDACDIIGYNGDIYFANWVDIVRVQGGSGIISLIDNSAPTAKSFLIYPASGYVNNEPQGLDKLFCLTGSGVLKQINLPSGTTAIYNLKSKIDDDIRDSGPMGRCTSVIDEPGRSSLLLNYNKKLHAFVVSATSGYHYLTCEGDMRIAANWTDRTESLPYDLRGRDGNVFGCIDEYKNKMYVMHTSFSDIGHFGYGGGSRGAGGVSVWQVNSQDSWNLIHSSVVGTSPRSLLPYAPFGPYIQIPSGSNPCVYQASDYAIVDYYLFDHFRRNVDVTVEYSSDNGLTWNTARRFKSYTPGSGLLGDSISNLPTTPEGIKYSFYWDYVNDVGFNQIKQCMLRIRPKLTR